MNNGNEKIKVFIAVHHRMLLDSLDHIISEKNDLEIVGLAGNVLDLIDGIESKEFDILIVDHELKNLDLEKVMDLNSRNSNANLIMLIDRNVSQNRLVSYVKLGVKGYFYKENALDEFLKSIRVIHEGELWVERKLLPQIINETSTENKKEDDIPLYDLTPAEFRVLKLVLQGHSNMEIANSLSISDKTVKFHLYKIFKKLSVKTRSQLIIFGYQNGLVT